MKKEEYMNTSEKSEAGVSRRDFIKGAGAAAAGAAILGLPGYGPGLIGGAEEYAKPYFEVAKWDYETEILVVGHGFAGISAVITACKEDLGKVLVIDAGPAGEDGGTSSVCGQVLFCPKTVEATLAYQKFCNEPYPVEEETMQAWAIEFTKNAEWLNELGLDMQINERLEPEWPEAPAAEDAVCYCHQGMALNSVLYLALKEAEAEFNFEDMPGTRARQLVYNPETKEVHGVIAETSSGEIAIKATKGVILACGGFENNREMMNTYYQPIGVVPIIPEGTPYNRGDGIKMAQAIGADLWHMNSYATVRYCVQACGEDNPASLVGFGRKSYIFVGPDGTRPLLEEWNTASRHGKVYSHGVWTDVYCPVPAQVIFDQAVFDSTRIVTSSGRGWAAYHFDPPESNEEALERGIIIKADTIEELAVKINQDPAILKETVTTYNKYCVDQDDKDYHRGKGLEAGATYMMDSATTTGASAGSFELVPIEGPPYYAMQLAACNINTQGGPKRNGRSEVLDTTGKPIPRLFSAGELGTIFSYKYNSGGDVGDGLASGRIAARSAGALAPLE